MQNEELHQEVKRLSAGLDALLQYINQNAKPEKVNETEALTQEAIRMLRELLANGPVTVGEMIETAEQSGIPLQNVTEARSRLGITQEIRGGGHRWLVAPRGGLPKAETTPEPVVIAVPPPSPAQVETIAQFTEVMAPPPPKTRTRLHAPLKDSPEIVATLLRVWPERDFTSNEIYGILENRISREATTVALGEAVARGYATSMPRPGGTGGELLYRAKPAGTRVAIIRRTLTKAAK